MQSSRIFRTVRIAIFLGLMGVAYASGVAQGADSMTLARLNSAVDFLVKARALVDAADPSQGANHARNAKTAIDRAIAETKKAIVANGG